MSRTIVNIIDKSQYSTEPVITANNPPYLGGLFTSDKGPEGFQIFHNGDYDRFKQFYGLQPDFAKHGQPNLQAYLTMYSGGNFICRRVVASDAKLANSGLVVHVIRQQKQKTNSNKELIYTDQDGNETTAKASPVTADTRTIIKFTLKKTPVLPEGLSFTIGTLNITYTKGQLTGANIDASKSSVNLQTGEVVIKLTSVSARPADGTPVIAKYTNGPIDTAYVGEDHGTVQAVTAKNNANEITFTTAHANMIKPGSVIIHVGSYVIREVNPKDGKGVLTGTNLDPMKQSTINYKTGVVSINYAQSQIPPNSLEVTIDYDITTNEIVASENEGNIEKLDNEVIQYAPVMINMVQLRYEVKTFETTSNDLNDASKMFLGGLNTTGTESEAIIPLFLIVAEGRGESTVRWYITPNYQFSRTTGYAKYNFSSVDNGTMIENPVTFSGDPTKVEHDQNTSLDVALKNSTQVRCVLYDANIRKMYQTMAKFLGLKDINALQDTDFLFGRTIYGQQMDNITVDTKNGVDISNQFGISLLNGDNGAFGDMPINAPTYTQELVAALSDDNADIIQNPTLTDLNLILDANYPPEVCDTFEDICIFRKDPSLLRSLGTEVSTITEFKARLDAAKDHPYITSYYPNYWDIYDPVTKKQITVTMTYNLVPKIIKHFVNGRNRPFAGFQYGITFPEVIPGTINYLPKYNRNVDESDILDQLRLNTCIMVNGVYTLNGVYTSQLPMTGLSYNCNVFIVQQVLQTIRKKAEELRFLVTDSSSSSSAYVASKEYEEQMQNELNKYSNNFVQFKLDWSKSTSSLKLNEMYMVLVVSFKSFINDERIDIVAVPC